MPRNEEEEDATPFQHLISRLNAHDIQRVASLLTSESDYYFLGNARNKTGSKRLQKLLGKSDDADALFADSIVRRFYEFMTHKHASYMAVQGMRVFNLQEKKMAVWHLIHLHAIHLACDRHGYVALNAIITNVVSIFNVEDVGNRSYLLDIVAGHTLC
ncbi:unnamed protein product [Thlaspi arvense]|uniref:Uncharacterized protein n=1 Tax=Thlaspi arvense TaxID=13288 RepID=A0AAU9SV24_THLAR|nr:unnamed protein product [Thlaspi arvense]